MAPSSSSTTKGAATRRGVTATDTGTTRTGPNGPPAAAPRDNPPKGIDPAYGIPLLGPLLAQADRFRTQLPLGPTWNKSEAEVLRAEARALHAIGNYLEARAKQLERLKTNAEDKPRVRRVKVD